MSGPCGTLYVVGTPIGNLEDITLRALRILRSVGIIACEDTRHTKKLLDHYGILAPAESYHKFSERSKCGHFIDILNSGKDVALVSDSGMPGISDPGAILINESILNGITVVPVPGPSAFVAALVISGVEADRFLFEGFLPSKEMARNKRLADLQDAGVPIIFYESPKRVRETLASILKIMGDRKVSVARELTKIYEESLRGNASEVLERLNKSEVRGEIVIVVEGKAGEEAAVTDVQAEVKSAMEKLGLSKKEAIIFVAKRHNIGKKEVYRQSIGLPRK